jgi:hypothetical protein
MHKNTSKEHHSIKAQHEAHQRKPQPTRGSVSYWFLCKVSCLVCLFLLVLFVVYKGVVAWRAMEEGACRELCRVLISSFCIFWGRKWVAPLSRALPWRVSMALATTLLCVVAPMLLHYVLHALFGELLTLVSTSWCVCALWVAGVAPAVYQLWRAAAPLLQQLWAWCCSTPQLLHAAASLLQQLWAHASPKKKLVVFFWVVAIGCTPYIQLL